NVRDRVSGLYSHLRRTIESHFVQYPTEQYSCRSFNQFWAGGDGRKTDPRLPNDTVHKGQARCNAGHRDGVGLPQAKACIRGAGFLRRIRKKDLREQLVKAPSSLFGTREERLDRQNALTRTGP